MADLNDGLKRISGREWNEAFADGDHSIKVTWENGKLDIESNRDGTIRREFPHTIYLIIRTTNEESYCIHYSQMMKVAEGGGFKKNESLKVPTGLILFNGKRQGAIMLADSDDNLFDEKFYESIIRFQVFLSTDEGDTLFSYRPHFKSFARKLIMISSDQKGTKAAIRHMAAAMAVEMFKTN